MDTRGKQCVVARIATKFTVAQNGEGFLFQPAEDVVSVGRFGGGKLRRIFGVGLRPGVIGRVTVDIPDRQVTRHGPCDDGQSSNPLPGEEAAKGVLVGCYFLERRP